MPLDVKRLLGAELNEQTCSWVADDLLLYHLALGAGADDACPDELTYTYERDLRALPSYAAVTVVPMLMQLFDLPGMDFDKRNVLHASHDLQVQRPLPNAASVRHSGRVEEVFDHGRHALVRVSVESRDASDGELMFVNRFLLFLAEQGGFGGERAPPQQQQRPARPPDVVARVQTSRQQALLFRLTGDRHPIHVDPDVARERGFSRPILHGLCTFGMAARFVVSACCDGDVEALQGLSARFAQAVYPGETLEFQAWRDDERVLLSATCLDRNVPVLSQGCASLRA